MSILSRITSLLSVAAALSPVFSSPLTSNGWELISLNNEMIEDPTRFRLEFNEDGSAAIGTDCNWCGSSYKETGTTLVFEQMSCTEKGCLGATKEGVYTSALRNVSTFKIEGGKLYLMGNSTTLIYQPTISTGEKNSLSGTAWQLASLDTIKIGSPKVFSLQFGTTSVSIGTDCNQCAASYSTSTADSSVSFTGPSCTMMYCQNSHEGVYLSALSKVTTYRMIGDTLVLTGSGVSLSYLEITSPLNTYGQLAAHSSEYKAVDINQVRGGVAVQLDRSRYLRIEAYTVSGKLMRELCREAMYSAGSHLIPLSRSGGGPGRTIIFRISSEGTTVVKKILAF